MVLGIRARTPRDVVLDRIKTIRNQLKYIEEIMNKLENAEIKPSGNRVLFLRINANEELHLAEAGCINIAKEIDQLRRVV
jgi:hypothetical protein